MERFLILEIPVQILLSFNQIFVGPWVRGFVSKRLMQAEMAVHLL